MTCMSTMSPGRTFCTTWARIASASSAMPAFESGSRDHITVVRSWLASQTDAASSRLPLGGRTWIAPSWPAARITASVRSICSPTWARETASRRGWSHVWLPISWPATTSCRSAPGSAVACAPITKKVPRASWAASAAITSGVYCAVGPSSNVKATTLSVVSTRSTSAPASWNPRAFDSCQHPSPASGRATRTIASTRTARRTPVAARPRSPRHVAQSAAATTDVTASTNATSSMPGD